MLAYIPQMLAYIPQMLAYIPYMDPMGHGMSQPDIWDGHRLFLAVPRTRSVSISS